MTKPLATFCVRRGVKLREFVDIAKGVFLEAAEEEIARSGYERSTSKISVMTGIQRFEVKKLQRQQPSTGDRNLAVRVVGLWSNSSRYADARGRPRKLTCRGARSEFARLVRAVSKDLNPHTVLFELERLSVLTKDEEHAELRQSALIAHGDPETGMRLVGQDAADLISAGVENCFAAHVTPNLHARTEYDNISDENLLFVRRWFLDLGVRIHTEARKFLSQFDRDLTPQDGKGTGRNRVTLGTFSLIEPFIEQKNAKRSHNE
ncbi:MAG: hypothetical protein EBZ48_06855 [Proteobacteria bacterium]|nr:hypothetical protein [Pseudomonadota bacterium]